MGVATEPSSSRASALGVADAVQRRNDLLREAGGLRQDLVHNVRLDMLELLQLGQAVEVGDMPQVEGNLVKVDPVVTHASESIPTCRIPSPSPTPRRLLSTLLISAPTSRPMASR